MNGDAMIHKNNEINAIKYRGIDVLKVWHMGGVVWEKRVWGLKKVLSDDVMIGGYPKYKDEYPYWVFAPYQYIPEYYGFTVPYVIEGLKASEIMVTWDGNYIKNTLVPKYKNPNLTIVYFENGNMKNKSIYLKDYYNKRNGLYLNEIGINDSYDLRTLYSYNDESDALIEEQYSKLKLKIYCY